MAVGTCLAVLVGAGCATKSDVSSLERTMQAQMQEMRRSQDSLARRIGATFDTLSRQDMAAMTGRGELARQFQNLEEMLAQLLELVSQNNRLLGQMRQGARSGPPADSGSYPEGGENAGGAAAGEARTFYEAALQQHRRGSFETARAGFQDFLENYPNHELAPDAQYFLAETFRQTGDRERALQEYARVLELYPDSRRAPTALYASGMVELERGAVSDARQFFQRVELGYPNSAEAPLARQQLQRLRP